MRKQGKYPAEIRERAVRLVFDHQGEYDSQWAQVISNERRVLPKPAYDLRSSGVETMAESMEERCRSGRELPCSRRPGRSPAPQAVQELDAAARANLLVQVVDVGSSGRWRYAQFGGNLFVGKPAGDRNRDLREASLSGITGLLVCCAIPETAI